MSREPIPTPTIYYEDMGRTIDVVRAYDDAVARLIEGHPIMASEAMLTVLVELRGLFIARLEGYEPPIVPL